MNEFLTSLVTAFAVCCAATTFAAAFVVAQRRLVASVARRFARLPRFEQALLVVAVCVTTVCAQKSGVEKVEVEGGSDEVEVRGGGGEWMLTIHSSPRPLASALMNSVGRDVLGTPLSQVFSATSNDSVLRAKTFLATNEVFDFSPPDGACLATNWLKRGAVTDFRSIRISGAFPFDGVDHSRLLASASGEILLFPSRIKLKPFAAPLGIVPEANWGEKASRFWHKQLDDGTLLLTWQNALLNRAAESPVSIQAELSPSGDITYRYDLSRLASDDLLTNVVVAAGTNLCTSVTNRAVTSWTLRSANSLRCDAGAADFAARRGDADLWACPPSSTNTVYEHLFYTGTTNAPFAYPTATSGTAILRVTVSGSGLGALLVGDRCVVLNAEEEVSNAEEEETGSRGDEEDGSASPSLSNLRAKNTTLLVPVTRGKTQKLFLRGDATLSVSLSSDDFAFGESPSIAAHRLNGWINFPLTATTTACFHGWNNPTRRVTLATGEDAEELTCTWIASKDVAVSNVPPRSAVFTKVGSPRTSPSVAYDLSHPLHLFGATRFEQPTRHCPPLPEIDAADGWWESGVDNAGGAEGCRCCVWGTCPQDCSCGCLCNVEAGRTPNTAEPDGYALSKTNYPHLTGVLKIRDPLAYSDTLSLDVPGGVRSCCPCPGHATNDVSLAFQSSRLKVVGEDGKDFERSADPTCAYVAAVSPSRVPGDAIVCFATNGVVSLSKGYTTLGVGIRKGRLDIAAFNRYSYSFGIPVPVGTNGMSLTRIDLVTKVGLDGGNVHLGFDETAAADFMILFWDSDAGAFRQLCRTGTDLDVSLENWKSLVGASSDVATATTSVYVAAAGKGSARLVFRYWGVFDGEFVEDEAKQRFASVDSPIRADVDHDGMIDAADEALSREGRPFRFWLNEDTAKGDYVGQVADESPNASDLKVNGRLDLVNLFPVEIDLSRFWSEWGMRASVKVSSPAGGLRYCALDGAVASNVWSLATEPLLTKNGEALEAAALTRLTGEGLFPWDDAGLRGRPFVLAFEASERVASGTCLNVTLLFDGEEISTFRLPLSVSSVDDMHRYADLRGAIGNAPFAPAVPGEPLNGPDAETDGRHFVFVHGYNVDAASSRRWARAMFKRLWWAGSRSKFTAVDWRGDDSQISVPTQGDISPNYYVNVKNAFMTAPALANLCGRLPGEKVMLGHSLGNMLVSSAAVDHNLAYSKYYMLNAAVPMEAYDRTESNQLMVDGAWSDVDESFRASRFANLFAETPSDFRACLSWRGRFAGIQNAVNCYSPTEDVLTNPATNKVFGVESSNFGGAWSKQELFKGCALWYGVNAVTFSGTEIEGGWGINAAYTANPLAYVPLVGLRPGYFENWTRENMITDPLFTSFDDERMASTNLLAIVDAELLAKMLGDAIPAESFAAGANETDGLSENYNLQGGTSEKWPEDRCKKTNGESYPQWRHSDVKDVSFYCVHEIFKKITKESIK